jgi:hypothetical protein
MAAGPPADVASVREAFAGLARALKRVSIYSHASDQHAGFLEPALAGFREIFERRGSVTVTVAPGGLGFEGESVYSEPPRELGLCYRLHRDGVRTLTFRRGLTLPELLTFTQSAVSSQQGATEDAVTELWKADLTNIQYTAAPGYRLEELSGGAFAAAVTRIADQAQEVLSRARGDEVEQTVLWTEEQRARGDPQSWGDLARRAASVIARIVEQDLAGWDLEALVETYWRLVDEMATRGEVVALVSSLDAAARLRAGGAVELRSALGRKLAEGPRLARAAELAAVPVKQAVQVLPAWIALLGDDAGPALAETLASGPAEAALPLAVAVLRRLGTCHREVHELLARGSATAALALITALQSVPGRVRGEMAAVALGHAETRVQLAAIRYLPSDQQLAVQKLAPLLQKPELRLASAEALSACGAMAEQAAGPLVEILDGSEAARLTRDELTALHRALGKLGSTAGFNFLAERLSRPRRGLLKRRRSEQDQLLSVQGLAADGSLRALRALEEGSDATLGHPPAVVAACRAAAQSIRSPRQREAEGS